MTQHGLLRNAPEVAFLKEMFGEMIRSREDHHTTIHNGGIELHAQSTFPESRKLGHNHHNDVKYRSMVEGLKIGVV